MDVYIGFDSAWTDNKKAPGAICAVVHDGRFQTKFYEPRLVSFAEAFQFIEDVQSIDGITLVAIDQPTIVPNLTSMRPVERAAASLISQVKGGVQPSNRGRVGTFCDESPIWGFLEALSLKGSEDPERARSSSTGLYWMEVFPALALLTLGSEFFERLRGPKYNPDRKKTFCMDDWCRVANVVAQQSKNLGCDELVNWCLRASLVQKPNKMDQDKLDSVICALIAIWWRLQPRKESLLLGDLAQGYMVLPASSGVRERLLVSAQKCGVEIDGRHPV